MEWIEKVLDKFESFLKRAFLPSMVFYFFIIVFSLFDNTLIDKAQNILESKQFIWIFIAFSVGLSYFLNMLHQLIFDNNIKKNYKTHSLWKDENKILKKLRKCVINKLKEDEKFKNIDFNDYILYQIIGKYLNTKRYVDDTKTYGIVFLSFILALIIFLVTSKKPLNGELITFYYFGFLFIIYIYILVFDAIKAKYRSRALRLYINYLQKL